MYSLDVDLDLDADRDDLRGLAKESTGSSPSLEEDLDKTHLALAGIPETGYRVLPGSSHETMSLWTVRFLGKGARPVTGSMYKKSRCWVRYTFGYCLWRGEDAQKDPHRRAKSGSSLINSLRPVEDFDFTLQAAFARMAELQKTHEKDIQNSLKSCQSQLERLQKEIVEQEQRLEKLKAFRPASVVPKEYMLAEELAIENAIESLQKL